MTSLVDRIAVVIDATSAGAVKELKELQKDASKTGDAFDTVGKKAGLAGSTIKAGLVAGAAALVGTGLVSFLQDSVDAYGDAAKAAGELATATGGSVDEVSRLQAVLMDAGISAEQSAGLITKFTVNVGKNQDLLEELGVTLKRNADGTVDYADAMVQTVDGINKMGDASKRNQAYVDLFGKQGAQAFQELAASGVDLADAMAAVSKYRVFDSDDVRRAVAYDDAMDKLAGSTQGLQFAVGEALVPALAGLVDVFADVVEAASPVVEFLGSIPGEVYLVVGAATALKVALGSEMVAGALANLGGFLATTLTGFQMLRVEMGTTAAVAKTTGAALGAAGSAAGPLLLLTAAVAGFVDVMKHAQDVENFTRSSDRLGTSLRQQADELRNSDSVFNSIREFFTVPFWLNGEKIERTMEGLTENYKSQAEASLESVDATTAQKQAAQDLLDVIDRGALATDEGTAAMAAYNEALSASDGLLRAVQESSKGLADVTADMVANGAGAASTWSDLATAAGEANIQILEQKQATELATIASGMYATSIQGVVEWQERLAGLGPSVEDSLNGVQGAYETLAATTDDPQTWGDEMEIQAGKAKDALYGLVTDLAAQGWSADQIKEYLLGVKMQPGASEQLKTDIDGVLAQIEGKGNEIPVDLTAGDVSGAQAAIDEVTEPQTAEVEIDVTNPKGAAYTIDQVAKERVVPMTIDITNNEGASWVLDRVARKRTAVIEIDVQGQSAAMRELAAVSGQQIMIPSQTMPAPVNLVRVNVDGRQLRATIRDELLSVRASDDLAAALGTVA